MLTVHFYDDIVILDALCGCAKLKKVIEHIAFVSTTKTVPSRSVCRLVNTSKTVAASGRLHPLMEL